VLTIDGIVRANGLFNNGSDDFCEIESLRGFKTRRVFGNYSNRAVLTVEEVSF
jgi:hypothetical protein